MTVIRQVIPTEVIYDRSQADVTAVALYQMHIDTTMTERKLVSYSGEPLKMYQCAVTNDFSMKTGKFRWQTGNILVTFKQGQTNAMSVCCDKDYFAFCEDASGNKLENCQDNLSGIAKRTANGAIDDSKSHLDPLYLLKCYNSYVMQNF